MRRLYLLLLIPLSYYSCKYKSEPPSNFHFIIDNGANDHYDSNKELFYREYYEENQSYNQDSTLETSIIISKKEYSIKLSNKDILTIYELYKEINFQDFPSEFEIAWDDPKIVRTSPSFDTFLEICENDICKKVTANIPDIDNPIKDKKKALRYKKLYDLVWKIIEEKEEYKMIPKSNIYYE